MLLRDVTETLETTQLDLATNQLKIEQTQRKMPVLFLRGDTIMVVNPPVRTSGYQ